MATGTKTYHSSVVIPSEMYFCSLLERWPLGLMNPSKVWLNVCRHGSVRLSFLGAFALLVTTWVAYALRWYSLDKEVKCDGLFYTMDRNVVLWSLFGPPPCQVQCLCPCNFQICFCLGCNLLLIDVSNYLPVCLCFPKVSSDPAPFLRVSEA